MKGKMDIDALQANLVKYGQGHLLQYWDTLNDAEKKTFYADLVELDLERINRYFNRCIATLTDEVSKLDSKMQPIPRDSCGSITRTESDILDEYWGEGLRLVSQNKVAVLLMAGGQGTRLGVPYPKGMYNVGLVSEKTLYQLQAERIRRVEMLAREKTGNIGNIIWYIMTSEHTKEPTLEFFDKHDFFGLPKENVVVFEQFQLPCMTFEGKIILDQKHRIAKAPDGNGGLYRALGETGILKHMEDHNIQHIHVYGVDNILVKMADPHFIGFCSKLGADCGAKVVEKAFPTEPVGVVCKVSGVYEVVEYSEISQSTAELCNPDGTLKYNAGNICNHYFTLDFLKDVVTNHEDKLKHHIAKKKIAYVKNGKQIKPTEPNGIKMEKFVFDVFQFSQNFVVWEVLREDEFSPLKNADGAAKDTPTTSRQSVFHLHRRFITEAGGKLTWKDGSKIADAPSEKDVDTVHVEVSPLVSYLGEGLEKLVNGKTFIPPVHIERTSTGEITIESS
ncbi:UDP-N-acetylhexosamine pyrophosphorylase-like isoform X2 [Tubulanus polymorphus]|uniref:UDP-N-acetylhexosamine pyrophosphorylase-like isoform X2 n=1 Tax=Tubulanus polymorphus TaxID=672921 RepID=UPI003DA56E2D